MCILAWFICESFLNVGVRERAARTPKAVIEAKNISCCKQLLMLWFFTCLDKVYTLFHRFLHHRSVYGLVHKHHHKQKAPSRGNLDAINVHPFEFVCGEYLHLACVYCVPCHAYAAGLFMALAGVFASLNHTRFDVSFLSAAVYTVKVTRRGEKRRRRIGIQTYSASIVPFHSGQLL